jgi:hypothetical protein
MKKGYNPYRANRYKPFVPITVLSLHAIKVAKCCELEVNTINPLIEAMLKDENRHTD